MNKPAPKEPSMDEILSSIRQIIADDDAAGASRKPSIQAAPPPMQAAPAAPVHESASDDEPDLNDVLEEIEPLALSPEQIVGDDDSVDDDSDEPAGLSFDDILADTAADNSPGLIDPDDIAFGPAIADSDSDTEAFVADEDDEPTPMAAASPDPAPAMRAPEPEPSRPAAAPAMPDTKLSSDIADQLLEPATNAAVRSTFSRLGALGLGNHGLTIEAMIRDMLRPMLKEWLDENLPSVVERLVEKEIERISRGE
jgi:cell pole-organizing protein PopZ